MEPELDDLDKRLNRFYGHQSLSPAGISGLKSRIEQGGGSDVIDSRRPRRNALLAIAASFTIVMVGVFLAARWRNVSPAESPVAHAAAREVAFQHQKQFSLDYLAGTMEQLSREMTKLDFNPVLPARMRDGPRLVGARYCAVRGQIAAQFRFTDAQGRPCTLYQTLCKGEFADLPAAQFDVDGTRVELWREAGLLMVLAMSDQPLEQGIN